MVEQAPVAPGRIFISYRREETAYPAGWLFDRLSDHFGERQIFKDIDSIEPGDDFVDTITNAVASCDVLLALIGDEWLTAVDGKGQRRLDDPNDFVRLEIEAALSRNVRVIPLLVDGARMPRADELPASLGGLVRRQALELSPSRFTVDLNRLLRVLEKTIAAGAAADGGAGTDGSEQVRAVAAPAAASDAGPPSEQPASPLRRLLSTPRGIALAVGAVVLLLVVAFLLLMSDGTTSDDGGSSDEPSSEEEAPSEEGSWPALVPFLAATGVVIRSRGEPPRRI